MTVEKKLQIFYLILQNREENTMNLVKTAMAGTMESSDILVTIEPRKSGAASRWTCRAPSCSSMAARSKR